MAPEKKYVGQRVWFADGSVHTGKWEGMPVDGVLVRMLYYSNGTKQIQHGLDYYYEASHQGGMIRGAGMDKDRIPERYPNAVIKTGMWVNDEYYWNVVKEAMDSNGDDFSRD